MDETGRDRADDFAEVEALAASAKKRLEATHPSLHPIIVEERARLAALCSDIGQKAKEAGANKKELYDELRTVYGMLGGALTAGNWQSPSFEHSVHSQAGEEEGGIKASTNDYKRDLNREETRYGEAFAREYIDHAWRLEPRVLPTSSGMSAVATVLAHIAPSIAAADTVIAGKASYFQNKILLERMFGERVIFVSEFDTEGILALAKQHKPKLVFFDTLCGAESLAMPNLGALVPALSHILPHASTVVLDNTTLSCLYQPLKDLPLNPFGMQVVVVESLLKYHQFGMDKVNGGIMWAPRGSAEHLFHTRMHMGTILGDAAAQTLPEPNRALLEKRLLRIGRNTMRLAQRLDEAAENTKGLVSHIVYPGLPTYPGYLWVKDMPFHGGFFTIAFKEGYQTISHYEKFFAHVFALARERGVDIVGGTSFGFNTTRLYIPARYSEGQTKPFVRVSVGTETAEELERLGDVFEEAMRA